MTGVEVESCYAIAPGHRLQWEEAQQAWVVLYPEGMVKLNGSAAEILQRCDGKTTLTALIADLETAFGEKDLADDVAQLIAAAVEHGWLVRR